MSKKTKNKAVKSVKTSSKKEFWKIMKKSTFGWLLVLAVWILLAGIYLGLAYLLDYV